MRNCVTWRLAGVAALLLAPGACEGAITATRQIGWLGAGDWQLRRDEGQAYLVKAPYKNGDGSGGYHWAVSSPTIRAYGDLMLGYDTKGRGPSVSLVKAGKGNSTRWAFETVSKIEAPQSQNAGRGIKEDPAGITFRAMATEGPYKGWYLATKDDGKGKKRLVLVREKKNATVFKYLNTYHEVR